VDADGQSARARMKIIARQRPLPALVQFSIFGERERVGGDDLPGEQVRAQVGDIVQVRHNQYFPSRAS
jgi:hypothetical protein